MKKIIIEIDCGEKYCNTCRIADDKDSWCDLFWVRLKRQGGFTQAQQGFRLIRCKQCIEAEVKL